MGRFHPRLAVVLAGSLVALATQHCGSTASDAPVAADASAPDAQGIAPTGTSCSDGAKNADETDVDCGGTVCGKCDDTRGCVTGADCKKGNCVQKVCVGASCTNGVKDADETDVDCGGASCAKCASAKACNAGSDCQSAVCTNQLCGTAGCSDGAQNGKESDVDCGGTCGACDDGKKCATVSDCKSGVCSGTCVPVSCADNIKNGTETDVNCGGDKCPKCVGGRACLGPADCASGSCTAGYCDVTCADGLQNGKETDVDCGGDTCGKCAANKNCGVAGDCASGVCTSNKCAAISCSDNVKNGAETDVDCGGGTCNKCGDSKVCVNGSDCLTGSCTAGKCGLPVGCNLPVVAITTCAQLQAIPGSATNTYALGNDIDCTASNAWNGGAGFAPITNFQGCFLGQYHTITGLYVHPVGNRSAVGMFQETSGARLQEVGLINVDVRGDAGRVGSLVGQASNTLVARNFASGTVQNTSGNMCGGLIGYMYPSGNNSITEDCYTTTTVIGATDYTGGLIGVVEAAGPGIVRRNYATGNVSTTQGGRAAGLLTYSWSTLQDSFATGNAPQGLCNGIFGSIQNSYYASGGGGCGAQQGAGAAYFKGAVANKMPYNAWDFNNVWKEVANDYPRLKGFGN